MTNVFVLQGQLLHKVCLNAALDDTFEYFRDFSNVVNLFPGIQRVMHFRDGHYRLIFQGDDGRGHTANVAFDVRCDCEANKKITIIPLPTTLESLNPDGVEAEKLNSYYPGQFSGEFTFQPLGQNTEVTYQSHLLIEFELPGFLKKIPRKILQSMGDGLMKKKLQQVGTDLVKRIETDFQQWFEQGKVKNPLNFPYKESLLYS